MAQSSRGNASDSHIRKLQFLRVLVPTPLGKLRIPLKISKHLQREPHDQKRAIFYSPCGKLWHINILHSEDDMYFDSGWPEFSKAHGLRTGYFVLFRYIGNMVFKVKVFDNVMCLKEYERDSRKRVRRDLVHDFNQPSNEGGATRSLLDSPKKRKKLEASENQREKLGKDETMNKETSQEERNNLLEKGILNTSPNSCEFPKFEKIVRAYNLGHKGMWVPKIFCTRNRLLSGRYILVFNRKGESWPIWFYPKMNEGFLGKGWSDFANDSKLKLGQKCVFQLVKENTFLVHVMELEAGDRRSLRDNCNNSAKFTKLEKNIMSYNSGRMILPRRFCLSSGLNSDRKILLRNSEGKSWPVNFYYREYKEGCLREGWNTFMNDNQLKKGDRCIFQALDQNTLLVNVVYSEERTKSNGAGPSCIPIKVPKEETIEMSSDISDSPIIVEKESIQQETLEISDTDPNDWIIEGPSYLVEAEQNVDPDSNLPFALIDERVQKGDDSNGFYEIEKIILPYNVMYNHMVLSRKFVKRNKLVSKGDMILRDCDGKTWVVSYNPYGGKGCLRKGWPQFCTDKDLKLGDKCIFNLVSKGTFLVRIEKKKHPDLSLTLKDEAIQNGDDSNRFSQLEKIILPYNLMQHYMILSKEFAKQNNLVSNCDMILTDSDGKTWPVSYTTYQGKGSFGKGWAQFSKDKDLKLGDKCIFKLVSEDTFLVHIQKNIDDSSLVEVRIEGPNVITSKDFNLTVESVNGYELIPSPTIEKTITPCTLSHAQTMFSKEFCKDCNFLSRRVITLKDSDGKSWAANFRVSREKGYLWGWKDFIKEKGLKLGNKCMFKLVDKDTLLVDVVEE